MRVVLATGAQMPVPDRESHLLVGALAAAGAEACLVAWDAARDWSAADLVVVRTTWDYVARVEEFLAWAARVAALTRLSNPLDVLAWNTHKGYLLELAAAGVPVVATRLVRRGAPLPSPGALAALGAELVVKPAVGSGARGARRGAAHDPELGAHLSALVAAGDALVQPYVASVAARGETSLVFVGDSFSHAVRKVPCAGDFRVQAEHGGSVLVHRPTADELRVARAALGAAPATCTYARVDLVATGDGPVVMELELVEPELFLGADPGAPARFAAAFLAEARRGLARRAGPSAPPRRAR